MITTIGVSKAHCNVTCPEVRFNCTLPEIPKFNSPSLVCPEVNIPKLTCGDLSQGKKICQEFKCPEIKCNSLVCPEIKWPKFNCTTQKTAKNLAKNCPQVPDDNYTALLILVVFLINLAVLILILQFMKIRKLHRQSKQNFEANQLPEQSIVNPSLQRYSDKQGHDQNSNGQVPFFYD